MARKFLLKTESLGLVGGMATRLKLDYRSFTLPFMPYDRDTQEQLEEGSFINFCIYGSHLCPPPPPSPPLRSNELFVWPLRVALIFVVGPAIGFVLRGLSLRILARSSGLFLRPRFCVL